MESKHWIFLSPHLDDVALSCGALAWDLARAGDRVEVWTLMAGLPTDEDISPFAQQIEANWGISGKEAIAARRSEDLAACAILGVTARHFDWLDVIYRRDADTGAPTVNDEAELFSGRPEDSLVDEITAMLTTELPAGAQLVMPIGLGNHVDHQAVVRAGERSGRVVYHYADYPYVLKDYDSPAFAAHLWQSIPRRLGEDALQAWQAAVLSYTSQLSTFWRDNSETRLGLRNYLAGGGGRLWEKTRLDSHPAEE